MPSLVARVGGRDDGCKPALGQEKMRRRVSRFVLKGGGGY